MYGPAVTDNLLTSPEHRVSLALGLAKTHVSLLTSALTVYRKRSSSLRLLQ